MTESDAGSDLANAKARAVPDGDDHFVLNGSKIWITNAGIASWYFVLARTGNGNATGSRALTGFVVEREMAGVTPGKKVTKALLAFYLFSSANQCRNAICFEFCCR